MLDATIEDYKAAIAAVIIKHRENLDTVNSTVIDHADRIAKTEYDNSQQTMSLINHATSIGKIQGNMFSPTGIAASVNVDGKGTYVERHWLFVIGTDNHCWCNFWDGKTWKWYDFGGSFSGGMNAYIIGSTIYVYGVGQDRNIYQKKATTTGSWTAWAHIGGTVGSLGQ